MDLGLRGKTALVTGGSKGIGRAVARTLAAEGARVLICSRDADALKDAAADIERATGGHVETVAGDLSQHEEVKRVAAEALTRLGRLDILVNNAGTALPKPFEEATLEELDRMIDLNVRGVFIATQAALKHLRDGGRIISIGSSVGERMMTPGLAAYSATKGAVKMFTQGLSREVGPRGITVNNVQPGPIDTDLNPADGDWATPQIANTALKRYGHVEDVAALVAFVAGPDASYITGASLTVDGGTNA